ncbi:MAG: NAD-dependent epimerase/dehydratase family protein [Candidatus Omnitrophica bacterium]|nr:NAD-dependent epimerase/dehydratase family protein [Candidatus Omnitrophota bacterium]
MKRVLITGGCGFVGSNLAIAFAGCGHDVTVFDNLSRHGSEILKIRVMAQGVHFVRGDVRKPEDLAALSGAFDLMIECSAEPSALVGTQGKDARYLLDVNLQGAINCFEWARERHVPVIFLSSSRVYPYDKLNACAFSEAETRFEFTGGCAGVSSQGVGVDMPLPGARSLYGATKLCAEFILKEYAVQYGLPSIINRCGVIAGPWQMGKVDQGVFTFWLANHYFKRPLAYIGYGGTGKQVRDLLHIQDLVDLVLIQAECLMQEKPLYFADIFNVGGGVRSNLSLQETTVICQELTGHKMEISGVMDARPVDMRWFITDNGNTPQAFNWQPRHSARDVLADTFIWLKENEGLVRQVFLEPTETGK